MPLSGTFDVLGFAETLELLAERQSTGRLHVRHRSYGANLFLEGGELVGADQSEHQTTASSGDVAGRLEEVCFEMLGTERGSFEFQPGKPSSVPIVTRFKVSDILDQARQRLKEWRHIQEIVPSMDLQARLATEVEGEVTIDQQQWRFLTAIENRRNLRAIGRLLNLSDFDVCRVIASLVEGGVIELEGPASIPSAGREGATIPTVPTPEAALRAAEPAPPGPGDEAGGPETTPPSDASADGAEDRDPADGSHRRRLVKIRGRDLPKP